jgi:flagellar biosynthetic protein FlhB
VAEQDNEVEKTLPPSERKLEQARESGSGLRSPDVLLVISVALVALGLSISRAELGMAWVGLLNFQRFWSHSEGLNLAPLIDSCVHMGLIVVGSLCVASLLSSLTAWVMNGFIFSAKAISFDLNRLNPFKKLGENFSGGGVNVWWPSFKGLSSLGLMILGVWMFIGYQKDGQPPLFSALKACAPSLVAFLFYAGLDLIIQIWKRNKSLSMSLQELKDEIKESEGNPEIKGKMRQIARQRARNRMMSAVVSADVVIVNPEHYLVALRWDPKRASAPIVVARARDLVALALKEKAKESGVAVLEAPPFARALWTNTKMDQVVPVEFYESVAVLLAWAYAIKDGKTMSEPVVRIPAVKQENINA